MFKTCIRFTPFLALGALFAACGGAGSSSHISGPNDTEPVDVDTLDDTSVDAQPDIPDTDIPDTGVPDTGIPDTEAPDSTVPDTHAPDSAVTDTQVVDPCQGIPTSGRCDGNQVVLCVVGTGSTEPFVSRTSCPAGTACGQGPYGATCLSTAVCDEGESECRGATLAVCEGNRWVTTSCPSGCNANLLWAECRTSRPTTTYRNTLEYEIRDVNPSWTGWSTDTYSLPAVRFLVLSFIDGLLHDMAVTDADGYFEIEVIAAAQEDDDDYVIIATIGLDGAKVAYAVASPELPPGTVSLDTFLNAPPPAEAMAHTWSLYPTQLPSMTGLYLSIEAGSGAAFVFDYLAFTHEVAREFYGPRPDTELILWLGFGTLWDCGACFTTYPTTVGGDRYASQIFMPADATNEPYWSDAVIAHELGHWIMATYGVSPGEGGTHILGVPTHPGIAWSEGFATWFSALVRGEASYYAKQNGLFFWVDLADRVYGDGMPWQRPVASAGLEQLIDEHEVTRLLLGLTNDVTLGPMLAALESPRMTRAPFARGYQRRTWDGLDANHRPIPWRSTGVSAPYFADYLDALVCDGTHSATSIDAVTEPWARYPYPSLQPRCQSGRLPFEVTWRAVGSSGGPPGGVSPLHGGPGLHTAGALVEAEVRWHLPLPADLVLTPRPDGLGAARVIPAGTAPGQVTFTLPAEASLEVSMPGESWRIHGVSRYEPRPSVPSLVERKGPRASLRGHALGPSRPVATRPPSMQRAPPPRALRLPGR